MLVVRVLYPVLRAGEWPGGFQTGRARQESVFYSQKVNAHYQGGGGNGNAQNLSFCFFSKFGAAGPKKSNSTRRDLHFYKAASKSDKISMVS